jgi:antitoxin HicB
MTKRNAPTIESLKQFARCISRVYHPSMTTYSYRIIIEPDENKTFHAYVPSLPGCHTWGDSIETARKSIKDAMDVYLRSLMADDEKIPEDNGIEIVEMVSLPTKGKKKSPSYA